MAVEGLEEERPWLGVPVVQVEAPEPPEIEHRSPLPDADADVFVGVRPDEVMR